MNKFEEIAQLCIIYIVFYNSYVNKYYYILLVLNTGSESFN